MGRPPPGRAASWCAPDGRSAGGPRAPTPWADLNVEREEEESCYFEILSVIFSEVFSLDTFRNRSDNRSVNNQATDETSHKLFSLQQQQIHFFSH